MERVPIRSHRTVRAQVRESALPLHPLVRIFESSQHPGPHDLPHPLRRILEIGPLIEPGLEGLLPPGGGSSASSRADPLDRVHRGSLAPPLPRPRDNARPRVTIDLERVFIRTIGREILHDPLVRDARRLPGGSLSTGPAPRLFPVRHVLQVTPGQSSVATDDVADRVQHRLTDEPPQVIGELSLRLLRPPQAPRSRGPCPRPRPTRRTTAPRRSRGDALGSSRGVCGALDPDAGKATTELHGHVGSKNRQTRRVAVGSTGSRDPVVFEHVIYCPPLR